MSIVPLHVGSGTRLKIFESMAARLPVVSTAIGAEGLPVRHPDQIRLADTAEEFAAQCLGLLRNETERDALACAGAAHAVSSLGWMRAVEHFESILRSGIPGREP